MLVQDEASAIVPLALSPKPGEVLVDVCAAPGGKSMTSAILSNDGGEIYSFDLHESKLSLIRDSAKRLGLSSIKPLALDATAPKEELIGKADKVLCDVPCSGLGVIGKKPDLRYKDIGSLNEELPSLQLKILEESARYLKPSGTLTYSTCTLNRSENEDVVRAFLDKHSDFYTEDFSVGALSSEGGMLTLYPHLHGTDGFFVSKLRRK